MTPAAEFLRARDFLLTHRADYASAYRGFSWPVLQEFNWALDYFDQMAVGNLRPALWIVEESGVQIQLSFAQLSARSNQVANWLRGVGVERGDRLLIMLSNEVALWESVLAAIKLGAVVIPCSNLLTAADINDRIIRGSVKHVIVGASNTEKFRSLPGAITRIRVGPAAAGWLNFSDFEHASMVFDPHGITRASDPLFLYFTSGTTSKPKLVLHTHQSYPVGHLSTMYWIGLREGDIHLNISSPGWAKHAWSCFFAPWNAGACVFIHNYARFGSRVTLDVLARHRVTTMCAPPTVWRMLIQEDLAEYRDRLWIRELVAAGEPLNPEVIDRVRASWGVMIRDGFGQTETTAQIGNTPGQTCKPGSMGRPLPGYLVTLVSEAGGDPAEGEICLPLEARPLGLMEKYLGDPEKTAEAMRDSLYHSGDVARRDEEGYITYVGRTDDVFKASDYRISPFELESVAIEHEAVAEAAAVPSPDPMRLAVPKIFVCLRMGFEPSAALAQDILGFLRDRLAPYKRIRRLEFIELPKTISGKIRRGELRVTEADRRAANVRGQWEFFEEDFAGSDPRGKTKSGVR